MNRFLHFVLCTLILFLLTTGNTRVARAWNKGGHMVTGAIAFQDLERTGDQEIIAAVIGFIQSDFNHKLLFSNEITWQRAMKSAGVAAETPEESLFLFMEAARWADDIRGTAEHCGACHYINYRFTPGQSVKNPQAVPQNPNIESAYAEKIALLTDATQAASTRAKALLWIFHLVGDVHQPLHTAALFTPQRPAGDRGGNDFYVRASKASAVINLHAYWDDLLIGSDRFAAVRNRAREIRAAFPRSTLTAFLQNTDFVQWARQESYVSAVRFAYLNGNLSGALPRKSPRIVAGKKFYAPDYAPLLPQNYATTARFQARQRAALAGYRLADLLRQWFGSNAKTTNFAP